MNRSLTVLTHLVTPRIRYACEVLFTHVLKVKVNFTQLASDIEEGSTVICYRPEPYPGAVLHIVPSGLLQESDIRSFEPELTEWNGRKAPFPVSAGDLPFDIFSATFYLCSRYEEYLPFSADKYGRFPAQNSFAFKNGFLSEPLINQWAFDLKEIIRKESNFSFPAGKYRFVNTVDIDNAYAYLEKGWIRTAGAIVRSLIKGEWTDLSDRLKTLMGLKNDPYNTFDSLIEHHKKYNLNSIFFFLVGDYGHNDKNVPITSRKFRSLIKSVNDYLTVGLHPSWNSNLEPERLEMEKNRLSETIHMTIEHSRNHFLKLQFPQTYRRLLEAEIYNDHTIGYPNMPSFRASIASSYPWYDLDLEKATNLMLHPFCFMEATFKTYIPTEADKVVEEFRIIHEKVRSINGQLITLWHNDTLSEHHMWKGWSTVYSKVIEIATEQN